jgi:hypothetical protein
VRLAGQVENMGDKRNAYRILVGKPEGKRPLGRPRRRFEDNIKIDWECTGFHWLRIETNGELLLMQQ